jgi:hypothetical protein
MLHGDFYLSRVGLYIMPQMTSYFRRIQVAHIQPSINNVDILPHSSCAGSVSIAILIIPLSTPGVLYDCWWMSLSRKKDSPPLAVTVER